MEKEIWRVIDGYPKYQVSNHGNVKRLSDEKILRQSNCSGNKAVYLRQSKTRLFTVHRLVALAFIPNPTHKPYVIHIDGRLDNNHVSNLMWCDASEKTKYLYSIFGKPYSKPNMTKEKLESIRLDAKSMDIVGLRVKYKIKKSIIETIIRTGKL